MKKIEMIIRQEKLDDLLHHLNRHQFYGITVTAVTGCGNQKGHTLQYRGAVINMNLLPKMKIEMVVKDNWVDEIIEVAEKVCRTGEIGDGKIFIFEVEDAVRIRTGQRGEDAIK